MIGRALYLASLASLAPAVLGANRFFPETGGLQADLYLNNLAPPYDLVDSHIWNNHSYWTSSYITGKNNHEYLLISHTISIINMYRASVIDLADPESFKTFTVFHGPMSNITATTKPGELYVDWGEFGFVSVDSEKLGAFRTFSERPEVNFNITVEMSAPVMLNGGSGAFRWANNVTTNEWNMPAGVTSGSFVFDGETVEVDPSRSLTWYDRQFEGGGITWTWFELHLDSTAGYSGEKYSIWFYTTGNGDETKGFATVRSAPGEQNVFAGTFEEVGRNWTSSITNKTYNLGWTVELSNGVTLNIDCPADNQELTDATASFITYEGFVNVNGTRKNGDRINGFGLVEVNR